MNWILEHLQIVIAVAASLAYWLTQRRAQTEEDETPKPRTVQEAEEAERTRRIQEEIRRKIAERRGGVPVDLPPPLIEADEPARERPFAPVDPFGGPVGRVQRKLEEMAAERERERVAIEEAEALERQRRLADEMRALEAERREAQQRAEQLAAQRRAREIAERQARETGASLDPALASASLHATLRTPAALRRAIVLREVLGPPVSLR